MLNLIFLADTSCCATAAIQVSYGKRGRGVGAGMDKSIQSHFAVLTCVFLPNPVTGIIVHGDTISLKKTHTHRWP